MSYSPSNSPESMAGAEVPIDILALLNRHNPSDFIDAVQACQFAQNRAFRNGPAGGDETSFWDAVGNLLGTPTDQSKRKIDSI